MRLLELFTQINESMTSWPGELRGARAVADYISAYGQNEVDQDEIEDMFGSGIRFVLKKLSISAIRPSEASDNHVGNRRNQQRFNRMDPNTMPPILVAPDGEIIDGHHRYRAALHMGLTDILAYVEI